MTDQPTPLTPDVVNAIVRDMDDPRYPTQITVFCDHCGATNTGDYMVREGMTSRERLDNLRGRRVDNASFFHARDPHRVSDEQLYDGITHEYAGWLAAATAAGVIR